MEGQAPAEGAPRLSPQAQLEVVVEESTPVSAQPATEPSASATTEAPPATSAPDTSMSMEPIESPEASAAATLASVANSVANSAAQAAVPSPVPAIPNPLPPGYNKDQPICANCSTQTTPLWRRSHDSTHILCNACALFFKMKGRPRPISLKTDVIKSRNRSKGKSTSKDRAGGQGFGGTPKKQDRGESTSRSREEGKVGKKSAPGGADMEEDELEDGRSTSFGDGYSDAEMMGRKSRKMAGGPYGMPMPGYGGHFPYPYPYPHPHPHAHQPYPPRARSRSSSSSRRASSLDARPAGLTARPSAEGAPAGGSSGGNSPTPPNGAAPYGYPPPPPGYHPGQPGLGPEGYYPYYGYPGYPPPPGQPYYPPGGPGYAQAQAQAHALARQAPAITHAQSDSRSKSETESPRSSASPPHAAAQPPPPGPGGLASYYPHPNPNYPHQPPPGSHHPYSHSPLSASSVPRSTSAKPAGDDSKTAEGTNGRVTLAPMQQGGTNSRSLTPGAEVHLPPIGSVASANGGVSAEASPPTSHVPRHTGLFSARYPVNPDGPPPAKLSPDDRARRTSISSNSASISGSSDGVRSPETNGRIDLPWSTAPWTADDERRGRAPHRFEDMGAPMIPVPSKGKGREFEEVDELDEDDVEQGSRMVGVEAGLGELRVVDNHGRASTAIKTDSSSRSRSSGGAEERGRSRGGYVRGRSQSTSRARAAEMRSPSIASSGRHAAQEAEIARLKNKVAELTFLNGLMQSRLGQLEGPGRVPNRVLTSMTAATPRPDPDMMEDDEEDEVEEGEGDELDKYGVKAQDPAVRASLLQFFRQQGGAVA